MIHNMVGRYVYLPPTIDIPISQYNCDICMCMRGFVPQIWSCELVWMKSFFKIKTNKKQTLHTKTNIIMFNVTLYVRCIFTTCTFIFFFLFKISLTKGYLVFVSQLLLYSVFILLSQLSSKDQKLHNSTSASLSTTSSQLKLQPKHGGGDNITPSAGPAMSQPSQKTSYDSENAAASSSLRCC